MSENRDSVFNEPQFSRDHFGNDHFGGDHLDIDESANIDRHKNAMPIGQGAWDEPSLSSDLAGERPPEIQTYAQWLDEGRARTSFLKSWGIIFMLALVSGLWAVLGAMLTQQNSISFGSVLIIVAVAPLTEEMMKGAATLMTIEKWPYIFRSPVQIVMCCMAAAAGFALLENLLYLHLYIPNPTSIIIKWRWIVCSIMHIGSSTIFSMGLLKIWRHTMAKKNPPQVSLGTPYFIAAAVLHGSYNFAAIIISPLLDGF